MVSWDKVCRPKGAGGLGLQKMAAVGSAFLSKLSWKLFNDQGLWVDQMQAKYHLDEHFFTINPKPLDSWVWRCILRYRKQFRKGLRWKVGNGLNINFWLDHWCTNVRLASLHNITDFSLIDTSLKVSHFISLAKEWDIAKLVPLIDPKHLS